MRLRTLVVATLASLALGAVAVPVATAANGTTVPPRITKIPALYKLPVTGVAKNGKKLNGTYAVQRFVVKNDKVYAIGTLTGRLKHRKVTRYGVMIPASLTGANGAQTSQATCQVLHLVLGPINLNLLGLRVTLGGGLQANQPIVLDITAQQGGGLLGDLLCGLTNSLSGTGILGQLNTQLQQLSATLTSLLSLLGAQGA